MTVQLDEGVAGACVASCSTFVRAVESLRQSEFNTAQLLNEGGFSSARQIGTVYSLFAGDDLQGLLDGFTAQAEAMSVMFAVGGGLLEAQDEAVAAALSKAVAEPAGLVSLGLMSNEVVVTETACTAGYGRVGPEDVSAASLEWMASGAEALAPGEYSQIASHVRGVAAGLSAAAGTLRAELGNVLGNGWQGNFATEAQTSVAGLTQSAEELSESLTLAAEKAERVHDGFATTKSNVGVQAASYSMSKSRVGPFAPSEADLIAADMRAAEEQARAVMNTEYSPSVMDANLDDLDFPAAYRVVSGAALDGPGGLDVANVWNTEGVVRPVGPGEPGAAAIAAVTGGGAGGGAAAAAAGGAPGAVTAGVSADAVTEQALLAARGGDGLGAGVGGASAAGGVGPAVPSGAGAAGTAAGGPVNAGTAAASAAPLMNGQQPAGGAGAGAGAGAAGAAGRAAGQRGGRSSDRSFGSAAGLLGGGGAAAAGAGVASRMGGAGTLSGLGAGTGGLAPLGGTPSASAGAGAVGTSASSSTSGVGAGRMGAAPMGMMGAGAGSNRDGKSDGHRPASYLVNATNTSEIVGDPVKVAPAVIGRNPDAPAPAPEPKPRELSPAQALVNKLKGR